ncbi:hypothetical protein K488DRAFT_68849 [Vararia minispora EC-137]|uniref:Uncharacterized protein n=1 Tax=Vararia minispora EC-137 TaxID=1314806 RepID=A0ACB8QT77_9AGAM|nr:hypothetical protein K488DRAFT_68849 [Vararia minispora EC-137]
MSRRSEYDDQNMISPGLRASSCHGHGTHRVIAFRRGQCICESQYRFAMSMSTWRCVGPEKPTWLKGTSTRTEEIGIRYMARSKPGRWTQDKITIACDAICDICCQTTAGGYLLELIDSRPTNSWAALYERHRSDWRAMRREKKTGRPQYGILYRAISAQNSGVIVSTEAMSWGAHAAGIWRLVVPYGLSIGRNDEYDAQPMPRVITSAPGHLSLHHCLAAAPKEGAEEALRAVGRIKKAGEDKQGELTDCEVVVPGNRKESYRGRKV